MHLAAARRRGIQRPGGKPCVVLAGGREPLPWERYAGHSFIETQDKLERRGRGDCRRSLASVPGMRSGSLRVCTASSVVDRTLVCRRSETESPRDRTFASLNVWRWITPDMVIREIESWIKAGLRRNELSFERRPVIEIPDLDDERRCRSPSGAMAITQNTRFVCRTILSELDHDTDLLIVQIVVVRKRLRELRDCRTWKGQDVC